jgi:regulator of sigma E protease
MSGFSIDQVLAFVLVLGPLVTVHELGHFLAARACGVRVLKFSIGFGPAIGIGRYRLRWVRNGTEFVIAWIPLGGFVKMLGEYPGEERSPETLADPAHALTAQSLWKKLTIVLAGPLTNLALPVLVFVAALWIGLQRPAAVVGMVEAGSPAAEKGIQPGDRVLSVNGAPVEYWDDLEDAVRTQPGAAVSLELERGGQRLHEGLVARERAGIDLLGGNTAVGWIGLQHERQQALLGVPDAKSPAAQAGLRSGDRVTAVNGVAVADWTAFAAAVAAAPSGELTLRVAQDGAGTPAEREVQVPALGSVDALGVIPAVVLITEVASDTPAAKAGLAAGDLIVAVDGEPVGSFRSFNERVRASQGRTLAIQLVRGGETRSLRVAPVQVETEVAPGVKEERYRIGVVLKDATVLGAVAVERVRNPLVALPRAFSRTVSMVSLTLEGLRRLVTGQISHKSLGGPIEIARQAHVAFELGWAAFISMLVFLSVNLGVLNLLPIPILDGGQAVMFSLEAALRDRFTIRAREIAQTFGLLVLATLMGFAFWNDLTK